MRLLQLAGRCAIPAPAAQIRLLNFSRRSKVEPLQDIVGIVLTTAGSILLHRGGQLTQRDEPRAARGSFGLDMFCLRRRTTHLFVLNTGSGR